MRNYDLVIRNARIVDGSGAPAFAGDVAVAGDRIAQIGAVDGIGALEIDAELKVLAPGFIDIHTHYDPQLCWDRLATPSPEHGVTSLIIGNCSISLAPVRAGDTDGLIRWFGSVEDMEGDLLSRTVSFAWESFEDYLDHLRVGLGPNVGAFVGHSALRAYVMGADAQRRAATAGEIAEMVTLLRRAIAAGAFGLSATNNHVDHLGGELPGHYAAREEWVALLGEVAAASRVFEVAPNFREGANPVDDIDYFGSIALETGATCSISPILHVPTRGDEWARMLACLCEWRSKGAKLFAQTQVRPLDLSIVLAKGSVMFSKTPLWREVMESPIARRLEMLRDPDNRAALAAEVEVNEAIIRNILVKRSGAAANQHFVGRTIGAIASDRGGQPVDVMIDIALTDDLQTEFSLSGIIHAHPQAVASLLDHDAIHIGAADAGAHITGFSGAGDTCFLFEKFVRGEKLMSVERAVQRLTSDLARDWNIRDRGMIREGFYADLVLFDPDVIARGDEVWEQDLPGGHGRFVRRPTGIDLVVVNGEVLVERGAYRASRPGRLI